MRIEPSALKGLGPDLTAVDAVTLAEIPLVRDDHGVRMTLQHGHGRVSVLRMGPRSGIAKWLLGRAREHAISASRIRGKTSETAALAAAAEALSREPGASEQQLLQHCATCRTTLEAALASIPGAEDDPFARSGRREVLQAQQAVASLVAIVVGLEIRFPEARVGIPGGRLAATPRVSCAQPYQARVVSVTAKAGPALVPNLNTDRVPQGETEAEVFLPEAGVAHAAAVVELSVPGETPWRVERTCEYFFVGENADTRQSAGNERR